MEHMANTPLHALRIPTDVWRAAVLNAKADGTTVTAVVIAALKRFNAKKREP